MSNVYNITKARRLFKRKPNTNFYWRCQIISLDAIRGFKAAINKGSK